MSEEATTAQIIDLRTEDERTVQRWHELKVQARNLQAEADAMRDQEIIPLIENGVSLSYGDQILVPEYTSRTSFDWERAIHDGLISMEAAKPYLTVKVERRLQFRKRDDAGQAAYEAYIEAHKPLYEEFKEARDQAKKKVQHEVIR